MTEFDSRDFRNVLGQFATGVTAVTAVNKGTPVGMAIGSFTSVSLDPPLVAFLPSKDSSSWLAIKEAGVFCVNVMALDQLEVCGVMASRSENKFEGVNWRPGPTGSPIIEGSVAYIDCEIETIHDGGDHDIVIGRVIEIAAGEDKEPLLFFKGGYGTFK
ncbi:MAG: flavin reductase family protein [Actinomycetota bacterium]|nr:flavin reductase family protein [Actinomycetota bacterium]MDG2119783.1 flavin reductase family protein [Actinomycetota bacterium]